MVDTSHKYIISRLIRLITIIGTLALILFILQVTVGVVNWDLIDYAAAGTLLFVAGAGIQLILLKISKTDLQSSGVHDTLGYICVDLG